MVALNTDFMLDALCLAAFASSEESKTILSSVLEVYRETKKKTPDSIDSDLEVFFDIIKDVVESDANLEKKAEINRVIIKIKKSPIAQKDPTLVDQVSSLLLNSDGLAERRIHILLHRLRNWVIMSHVSQDLRMMMFKCNKYNPIDDMTNDVLLNELAEHARNLVKLSENCGGLSETIDMVDLSNPESIARSLSAYKNRRTNNIFPTGLKGLNRMLGVDGGFKRGESVAFAACSHDYKTQMMINCAKWCATLSKFTVDPGFTPCVVLISLENEIPENTNTLITRAYVSAYHEAPPPNLSDKEICEEVAKYYTAHGVKFLMYRQDDNFGYSDFVKLMTDLKSKGMCVIATILDYITLMRMDEDSDNPAKRIQKLAHQLVTYAKRNNMLFITGIQLDSRAEELNSSGRTNVVREYGVANLADCKGLKREFDVLIFMHIEKNQDEVPYLTVCWNKHRDETPPPKEDRYFAYRFAGPVLGIMDDYDTDIDNSVRDIFSDKFVPDDPGPDLLFSEGKVA